MKQHNPGRGVVHLKNIPGRLVNRDTGETIPDAFWADLDAGQYHYHVRDAAGNLVPETDAKSLKWARGRANLAFEPAASQEVIVPIPVPPIIEEAKPAQIWPASEGRGDDHFLESDAVSPVDTDTQEGE